MSYRENRHQYYKLIEDFTYEYIDGVDFERKFAKMWRKDRDDELSNFKPQTVVNKQTNTPHQEIDELAGVLSRIFTACDVFNPDADARSEYEYDETELRDFVRNILAENLSLFM
jgi:hypothetical protein